MTTFAYFLFYCAVIPVILVTMWWGVDKFFPSNTRISLTDIGRISRDVEIEKMIGMSKKKLIIKYCSSFLGYIVVFALTVWLIFAQLGTFHGWAYVVAVAILWYFMRGQFRVIIEEISNR